MSKTAWGTFSIKSDVGILYISVLFRTKNSKFQFFRLDLQKSRGTAFEPHKQNGRLNARVLVLNQSYEALTICSVKKALILLILAKAELVSEDNRKRIKSLRTDFAWPSVIRLKRYISVPYKQVILTRRNILKRDNYKCVYCGRGDLPLTIDHVIPKARGGKDTWENLVCACTKCNNQKGNHTPAEAGLKLLQKPYVPNHILFIKNSVGKVDENWKPYLFVN